MELSDSTTFDCGSGSKAKRDTARPAAETDPREVDLAARRGRARQGRGRRAPIPPMCIGGTAGLFAAEELDTYFIAITPPYSAFWL
jgi:hypothetical protein